MARLLRALNAGLESLNFFTRNMWGKIFELMHMILHKLQKTLVNLVRTGLEPEVSSF